MSSSRCEWCGHVPGFRDHKAKGRMGALFSMRCGGCGSFHFSCTGCQHKLWKIVGQFPDWTVGTEGCPPTPEIKQYQNG